MTVSATAQSVREQVAWACRILALEGYSDLTLGHVSARPAGGEHVYIKRKGSRSTRSGPTTWSRWTTRRPPCTWRPSSTRRSMRRGPTSAPIVHAHPPTRPPSARPTAELELLTHDAVLFADGVAYFEETSELITDGGAGRAVAEALGHRRAVILRNHGVVVADRDVRWAVLSSITLERAVRLQAIATGLGELRPIPRGRRRADARRQVPGALRRRVLGRLDPQRPASRAPTTACLPE